MECYPRESCMQFGAFRVGAICTDCQRQLYDCDEHKLFQFCIDLTWVILQVG